MTGQIRDMGIGNLAGYTNLSENQKKIIINAYMGFDNELDYTLFIHNIMSLNLGIPDRIYKNVLLKEQFYYFFIKTNPDFYLESVSHYVRLGLCKFLISVFEKSLHKFSDRALEFDIWELEKKQVKGQIGKMNTG